MYVKEKTKPTQEYKTRFLELYSIWQEWGNHYPKAVNSVMFSVMFRNICKIFPTNFFNCWKRTRGFLTFDLFLEMISFSKCLGLPQYSSFLAIRYHSKIAVFKGKLISFFKSTRKLIYTFAEPKPLYLFPLVKTPFFCNMLSKNKYA